MNSTIKKTFLITVITTMLFASSMFVLQVNAAGTAYDLTGTWLWSVVWQGVSYPHTITISTFNSDGTFSGTGHSNNGPEAEQVTGQLIGDSITFRWVTTSDVSKGVTLDGTGKFLSNLKMSGTGFQSGGYGPVTWDATRIEVTASNISGTWSGTYSNVGVEDYSAAFTISQTGNQFSGTASFVIKHSDHAPQDAGKSFIYDFTGSIDSTGKIHITGSILSGPPEIASRAGVWNMDWQLSKNSNTISFYGNDEYGNLLNILLDRKAMLTTSPIIQPTSLTFVSTSLFFNVLLGLLIIALVGIIVVVVLVLGKRKLKTKLPPQPPPIEFVRELREQKRSKDTPSGSSTPFQNKLKRPLGITVLSFLWILGGLFNSCIGLTTLQSDFEIAANGFSTLGIWTDSQGATHYKTLPSAIDAWLPSAIPAEMALMTLAIAIGILQFIAVYGFINKKRWAHRMGFIILGAALLVGLADFMLLLSAPVFLGASPIFLIGNLLGLVLIGSYLKKPHVKEWLNPAKTY